MTTFTLFMRKLDKENDLFIVGFNNVVNLVLKGPLKSVHSIQNVNSWAS